MTLSPFDHLITMALIVAFIALCQSKRTRP
ncbi:hypothetical protein FHS76_004245 [Ochrobactrum daejeonense]|uniref:Uncharacterized protein n=1 Tax=Brucella daejeonensis TaxID=659015 RepID=A0A7W9B171_9HYPH|nr:hypothetical protein [Brucella daejeonensis]